ncbi:hypothetical protein GW17_00048504 [Ensete ventricosum]|nr:hypothetical protein GW17_00048504 [Ensete ventricosum]
MEWETKRRGRYCISLPCMDGERRVEALQTPLLPLFRERSHRYVDLLAGGGGCVSGDPAAVVTTMEKDSVASIGRPQEDEDEDEDEDDGMQ